MTPRKDPLIERLGPWILDGFAMIAGFLVLVPLIIFAIGPFTA